MAFPYENVDWVIANQIILIFKTHKSLNKYVLEVLVTI